MEKISLGNVEVTASGNGIRVKLDPDAVNKISGYKSKDGIDKCNVVLDINELIDVLNQDGLYAPLYGFMEAVEGSGKVLDDNGVDTEGLGKTPESATEELKASTPVAQFEDVHAETFDDVEAKSKRGKAKSA